MYFAEKKLWEENSMAYKDPSFLHFGHDQDIRILTLEGLKRAIDTTVYNLKEEAVKVQEGFKPTVAEKIKDESNDGKLHIAIKRKKLKFNLKD